MNSLLIPVVTLAAAAAVAAPSTSLAWGDEGHEVIATLAYKRLTPKAKKAVDALLATDGDTLTQPDFVSRATWADKYRDSDRNSTKTRYNATREWHFVDIEIDGGSLSEACFGRQPLPAGVPAAQGPAEACIVDKLEQRQRRSSGQRSCRPCSWPGRKTLPKNQLSFNGTISSI